MIARQGLSVLSHRGSLVFRLESVRGANPEDTENEEWLWNLYHDDRAGLRISHADSSEPWVDEDAQGVIVAGSGSMPDEIATAKVLPISYFWAIIASAAALGTGYMFARYSRHWVASWFFYCKGPPSALLPKGRLSAGEGHFATCDQPPLQTAFRLRAL
jgi:hypothetical protein